MQDITFRQSFKNVLNNTAQWIGSWQRCEFRLTIKCPWGNCDTSRKCCGLQKETISAARIIDSHQPGPRLECQHHQILAEGEGIFSQNFHRAGEANRLQATLKKALLFDSHEL
jgi:hypothetical protein